MVNKKKSGLALGIIIVFIGVFMIIGSAVLLRSYFNVQHTTSFVHYHTHLTVAESALHVATQVLFEEMGEDMLATRFNNQIVAALQSALPTSTVSLASIETLLETEAVAQQIQALIADMVNYVLDDPSLGLRDPMGFTINEDSTDYAKITTVLQPSDVTVELTIGSNASINNGNLASSFGVSAQPRFTLTSESSKGAAYVADIVFNLSFGIQLPFSNNTLYGFASDIPDAGARPLHVLIIAPYDRAGVPFATNQHVQSTNATRIENPGVCSFRFSRWVNGIGSFSGGSWSMPNPTNNSFGSFGAWNPGDTFSNFPQVYSWSQGDFDNHWQYSVNPILPNGNPAITFERITTWQIMGIHDQGAFPSRSFPPTTLGELGTLGRQYRLPNPFGYGYVDFDTYLRNEDGSYRFDVIVIGAGAFLTGWVDVDAYGMGAGYGIEGQGIFVGIDPALAGVNNTPFQSGQPRLADALVSTGAPNNVFAGQTRGWANDLAGLGLPLGFKFDSADFYHVRDSYTEIGIDSWGTINGAEVTLIDGTNPYAIPWHSLVYATFPGMLQAPTINFASINPVVLDMPHNNARIFSDGNWQSSDALTWSHVRDTRISAPPSRTAHIANQLEVLRALDAFIEHGRNTGNVGVIFGAELFIDRYQSMSATADMISHYGNVTSLRHGRHGQFNDGTPLHVGFDGLWHGFNNPRRPALDIYMAPLANTTGIIPSLSVGRYAHSTTTAPDTFPFRGWAHLNAAGGMTSTGVYRFTPNTIIPISASHNNGMLTRGIPWTQYVQVTGGSIHLSHDEHSEFRGNMVFGVADRTITDAEWGNIWNETGLRGMHSNWTGNPVVRNTFIDNHSTQFGGLYQSNFHLSTYRNTVKMNMWRDIAPVPGYGTHNPFQVTLAERMLFVNALYYAAGGWRRDSFGDRNVVVDSSPFVFYTIENFRPR